jgi:hypothetical protein
MDFKELGVICLNQEIRDECQGCLWLEWDSLNQCCVHAQTIICPLSFGQLPAHPLLYNQLFLH